LRESTVFLEILRFLDEIQGKNLVLLTHQNADPDAICSAYAFTELLERMRPKIKTQIGLTDGINKLSKNLLRELPIKVANKPDIAKFDIIGLMDTNTIQQLSGYAETLKNIKTPIIVIDHHAIHPKTTKIAKISIVNDQVSSTCELIYTFFKEMDLKPSQNVATAMFLGIACDTRHFILSKTSTFKVVSELIDWGVNIKNSLSLLFLPFEYSERIARLKAMKRSKMLKIGGWISVSSIISSYQASVARALIALGADVAAVVGLKDGKLTMCIRSTIRFYEKTRIHLGKQIAMPLGTAVKGVGGGHPTAAGVNGEGAPERALVAYTSLLKEALSKEEKR